MNPTALATAACWDLLRSQTLGRLAVVMHDAPEIFPVNYAVGEEAIVFSTGAGT